MLETIYTKSHKLFGQTYEAKPTEYQAEIVPGQSIRIVAEKIRRTDKVITDKTFKIGDYAEYDSYNMSYYGKIVKITEKQVWIEHYERIHRLDLHKFAWRNYDFDAQKAADHNMNESYYI